MTDIAMTDAERHRLLECLNQSIEPPADLAAKLFPSVCGGWDVRRLNRASNRRNTSAETLLAYGQFKWVGYGDYNTRFLRYFLARIEAFIAKGMGDPVSEVYSGSATGSTVSCPKTGICPGILSDTPLLAGSASTDLVIPQAPAITPGTAAQDARKRLARSGYGGGGGAPREGRPYPDRQA